MKLKLALSNYFKTHNLGAATMQFGEPADALRLAVCLPGVRHGQSRTRQDRQTRRGGD
jgi:hypothetical protein